ncbi:MAG: hypothetical protein H6869_09270 [Rhodospirillales bacterium]|nr:hypothetical protein [Rhodospirillales bacterium]
MLELRGYDVLIEDFLKHKITVKEFERQYLDKFATERILGDELYEPLNWLFAEVDCYTDMPIGPDDDPAFNIDESQLRKSAAEVLQKIRALD